MEGVQARLSDRYIIPVKFPLKRHGKKRQYIVSKFLKGTGNGSNFCYILHVCSPLLVTICTSFKVNRGLVIVQLKFVIVSFDGDYSTVTVFL